jgi:hypothetical protein
MASSSLPHYARLLVFPAKERRVVSVTEKKLEVPWWLTCDRCRNNAGIYVFVEIDTGELFLIERVLSRR